ncbi:MAG TPA: tyrosine-type recombinase/integrase [Opitutaceae bacterium]|nr:tyrosine-type recombinase/integrase [Opitutaceae bacterium]
MKNHYTKQNPVQISSTVQEVSKPDSPPEPPIGRLSPTHLTYWEGRVFQAKYKRKGKSRKTANFSCKIQFAGRRESFPLHTANKDEAAQKAREIYLAIVRKGWEDALRTYKRKPITLPAVVTVGEFLRLVALTHMITSVTLATYATKLRSVVAFIRGLGSGRGKGVRRLEWRAKVDQTPLSVLTLDAIKSFKRHILSRGEDSPHKHRQVSITYDGYIRNLRSLFREAIRNELAELGVTIPPQQFDQMPFVVKGRSAYAYVSVIHAEALMKSAIADLMKAHPNAFIIFVLALLLGLRRTEIDRLRWDMVNWERKHLALVPHEFLHLKTPGSSAPIPLEPELLELLREHRKRATGDYVVASKNPPRNAKHYRHYRCEALFKSINRWLRNNGVSTQKPLHTLRKECGSLVVERYGLLAAKNLLRHATIAVTVTYYVQDRREANTGLGGLLPVAKIS